MKIPTFAIVLLSTSTLSQQDDKAVARQQAIALLTQARQIATVLPPSSKRSVLDDISIALFQAGDEAGSTATTKEAVAADQQEGERERTRPQRQTSPNSFAGSGAEGIVSREAQIAQVHALVGDKSGARTWIQLALASENAVNDDREKVFSIGRIAEAQIALGDYDQAQHTIAEIPQQQNSIVSDKLGEIAERLARSGEVQRASSLASGRDPVPAATILEHVGLGQAAAGDFKGAAKTASLMEGPTASLSKAHIFVAVAEAEHKAGDEAAATQAIAQALAAPSNGTVVKQLVALSLARMGRFTDALEMGDAGANMEIAVLAANAGRTEIAHQIIARAHAAILKPPASGENKSASFEMPPGRPEFDRMQGPLQTFAIAQAQAGDITGALETARSLDPQWAGHAFDGIASEQARRGDIAGAERTLAEGPTRRSVPPELATAKARAGEFDDAFQLARSAMPNTELENVFRIYCKVTAMEKCLAAVQEMTLPQNKAIALIGMAENLLGTSRPLLDGEARRRSMTVIDPRQ